MRPKNLHGPIKLTIISSVVFVLATAVILLVNLCGDRSVLEFRDIHYSKAYCISPADKSPICQVCIASYESVGLYNDKAWIECIKDHPPNIGVAPNYNYWPAVINLVLILAWFASLSCWTIGLVKLIARKSYNKKLLRLRL